MNYVKDIQIDENSLDIEWLEQAQLAVKYAQYWNECNTELIRAEENVKVVTAELIAKVNEDPDECLGIGIKPTVANIESFYRNHPDHKAAKERWIVAMSKKNDAEIIKNEIAFTRKTALENLVQLHGQQYFAGPKVPRNLSNERLKFSERQENNKRIRKI
jgi:hypothetical protein